MLPQSPIADATTLVTLISGSRCERGRNNGSLGIRPDLTFRFALLLACAGLDACSRTAVPVPADTNNIFDVGAADLDGDGWDDFYTLNHSGGATLLRSTGNPARPFVPLTPVPQDPRFPALSSLRKDLAAPEGGALVYWAKGRFNVLSGALERPVSGVIHFAVEPVIAEGKGTVTRSGKGWAVRFQLPANSSLRIKTTGPYFAGYPVRIVLDSDPRDVSIGRSGDHPDRDTTFWLKDYHALAVRDLNGDGKPDFVLLGGGMTGRAAELIPNAKELLMLSVGKGYSVVDGPPKLNCATRGARWEGNVLRVVCARGQHDNVWTYQNRTWRGGPTDRSTRIAKSYCPGRRDGALCASGDFLHNGKKKYVVAVPLGGGIYRVELRDRIPYRFRDMVSIIVEKIKG